MCTSVNTTLTHPCVSTHCRGSWLGSGVVGANFKALGEFDFPYLCGVDTEGCLLIGDWGNCRLLVVSPRGEFSVVRGVEGLDHPVDVVVSGQQVFVLHGVRTQSIQTYNIK